MNNDLRDQLPARARVAIQGGEASFHEIIAHETLGREIEIVPCASGKSIRFYSRGRRC